MTVLRVDAAESVQVRVQDGHHVALLVAVQQRLLDAVDEEHAVGQLGERIVEGAVGELGLQRGDAHQRVVQPAALQGHGHRVGERLEDGEVALRVARLALAMPDHQVAHGAIVVTQHRRDALADSQARGHTRHAHIVGAGAKPDHRAREHTLGPVIVVFGIDGTHHLAGLTVAQRGAKRCAGGPGGEELEHPAVGAETSARGAQQFDGCRLQVARHQHGASGVMQEQQRALLAPADDPRGRAGREREHRHRHEQRPHEHGNHHCAPTASAGSTTIGSSSLGLLMSMPPRRSRDSTSSTATG